MVDNNSIVQSVQFYEFGKKSLWLNIVHNKQWNRISLNITRKFIYIKDGETKEGSSSTYLNLPVAKALIDQLPLVYQLAKTLQNNQGVVSYNIFYRISKLCYSFSHRSVASDCERLDRWSARRHYRSWRHRSLKYCQPCAGRMRINIGADREGFGNFRNVAGPLYASNSGSVSSRRPANAGAATTQSCLLPKENADQNKATVKPILWRINASILTNWQ